MKPKILVGCPTSFHKEYCLNEYAKSVKELSYNNYDILLVDNSSDDNYLDKIKSYGLNAIKGIRCLLPPGSFYVFPNISRFLKKRFNGKIINTSADFADFLLEEAEVAVVPGEAFGGEGHIRMAYATSMENIKEGLKRIEDAVTKLE